MGVDLSRFSPAVTKVPTIYQANFRDPSSFFAAQQFTLRDKDVLYVSNASSVELTKFLGVINAAFVPPATVIRLAK
jgi:polysaccharide export outer membrane protein